MISDPPRAMLKAWADLYAIELFEGDTMQDIRDRLTARFLIPVEEEKEFGETQWFDGEHFEFETVSEEDEEPKPLEMSQFLQTQLVYWENLHQLNRLPEETDHSFLDRLLLKAKRLVPQEPEETDEELKARLMNTYYSEPEFEKETDEEPKAKFMNINPYLPRDYVAILEKLYSSTLERGTDVDLPERSVVRLPNFEFFEISIDLEPLEPKESVMDITRDFIKGRL